MGRISHFYKLTETVNSEAMQIAGVNLSKEWTAFPNMVDKLLPFIKSEANRNGLVDYEKRDCEANEVLFRSIPDIKDIPIYSKALLLTMTRSELCDICRAYAIVTTNKVSEFLVKEILEKQIKLADMHPSLFENKEVITVDQDIKPIITTEENKQNETIDSKQKSILDILKKNR
jgi:hypothetical protein